MNDEPTPDSPEVREAKIDRDALLAEVKAAIKNVDRLVAEYAEAERKR